MRPLVYLHPAGATRPSRLLEGLALSFAVSHEPVERGDVMGCFTGCAAALRLALEQPQLVDHLVLLSPAGLDEALLARLDELGQTTLIVQGADDAAETARLLKSRLRRAFLVYVWQAGHDLETEQPERVLAVVTRFLEHSDAFMVNRA